MIRWECALFSFAFLAAHDQGEHSHEAEDPHCHPQADGSAVTSLRHFNLLQHDQRESVAFHSLAAFAGDNALVAIAIVAGW